MAGDESGLPARDAGPVKRFVRDYVDGRRAAGGVLHAAGCGGAGRRLAALRSWGLVNAQGYVSMLWLVLTLFILVDTTVLLMRMNRRAEEAVARRPPSARAPPSTA